MSILLASGNPLGLRALGSGGRTAVASYEQIARTLRQTLGPQYAALFAEPSARAATIDWFAEGEPRDHVPVRLLQAPAGPRDRGLARLGGLVRAVDAKAVALKKSDRQDERILGDMLAYALEIPDEDAVFLVGDQPVMTFWGHVRDLGQPALKPLQALLQRAGPAEPEQIVTAATAVTNATAATDPPDRPPGDVLLAASTGAAARSGAASRWPIILLWVIFAAILVVCGLELLRGCAIGLPRSLTGWLIDYCPASGDAGTGGLAAEQAKQAQLQAEYDELVRQASLRRQACLIKTGKGDGLTPIPDMPPVVVATGPDGTGPDPAKPPGPAKPVDTPKPADTPKPPDQMRIPDKADKSNDGIAFLEGCWRAHEGLNETHDGKDTGKRLTVTYCFDKKGTGSRTIRYDEDGAKCRGAARARLDGEKLVIDIDDAPCEAQHGDYSPAVDECRRGAEGVATCDEVPQGNAKPNFKDFPFTRTNEQP